MYLCIDLLAPAEAQSVYFDNVTLVRTVAHHAALSIVPAEMVLDIGQTKQLTANISSGVNYVSSDTSIATVSDSGRVTGKAPGRVTITASYGDERSYCTVWVKSIPDGTYFIKNESNQGYLRTSGENSFGISGLTGADNQKWEITYEGSLNHSIVSCATNKAITVVFEGNNVIQGITQGDYTGDYSQCWSFDNINQLRYIIAPTANNYCDPDKYLAINSSGTTVSAYAENTTNNRARWIVSPTNKIVIYNYYDNGFSVRPSASLGMIKEVNNDVADRLDTLFSIDVETHYISFQSIADDCKGTNVDGVCSHSTNCASTAKLRDDLINNVGAGSATSVVVLWTGHNNYPETSVTNILYNTIIMTPTNVLQFEDSIMTCETNKLNRYKIEFMHELSHKLSAEDHYCYKQHGETQEKCSNYFCMACYSAPGSTNCLMYYESSFSDVLYCNTCTSMINSYVSAIR